MLVFENIQSFLDYIPNCLICSRPLKAFLESYVMEIPGKKRFDCGGQNVKAPFFKMNELYHFQHKSHSFSINPITNEFVDDKEFSLRLSRSLTSIRKNCSTCHFKIKASGPEHSKEVFKVFPPLTLHSEELHFTMPGGKQIEVRKNYRRNQEPELGQISVNGKPLPKVQFEVSKFSSFEQLKNRIKTILIFQ